MPSPEKKKRKKKATTTAEPSLVLPPTPESIPNHSLPNDLLVSCLARVSRLYYPTLSLVSKSFRTLLTSPELYETRSSLGHTESCPYLCLKLGGDDSNYRWFTLCRKPNQTQTNRKTKKSSGYVLAQIPLTHYPPAHWSGLVAVGSSIYNIGGPVQEAPSSSVSILDCRSHTWREAPSMLVKREYPAAHVVGGKIYVIGGCKECSSSSWMEAFDLKTETWELVPSPGLEICGCDISQSAVVDGKVYMFGKGKGLAYIPEEGRWKRVGWEMDEDWTWYSYCVIDNILYSHSMGEFNWYDTKVRLWRKVLGLDGSPKFANFACPKLANHGGKMVAFWTKFWPCSGYKKRRVWCVLIALERRNSEEEIWGKAECFDAVLTVPESCRLEYALSVTV